MTSLGLKDLLVMPAYAASPFHLWCHVDSLEILLLGGRNSFAFDCVSPAAGQSIAFVFGFLFGSGANGFNVAVRDSAFNFARAVAATFLFF